MKRFRRIFATALLSALVTLAIGPVVACEEYEEIGNDDLKAYRDKLSEVGADPLDQLFAFEALACSNKPTVRAYAIKAGLEGSTDPIVRQQIMLEAMLQKTRIDIDLVSSERSTQDDKKFIKEYAGRWSREVKYGSATEGCISLDRRDSCLAEYALYIRGDKVEFGYHNLRGEFQLTDANELVGFVIPYPDDRFSRIPATIRLF